MSMFSAFNFLVKYMSMVSAFNILVKYKSIVSAFNFLIKYMSMVSAFDETILNQFRKVSEILHLWVLNIDI